MADRVVFDEQHWKSYRQAAYFRHNASSDDHWLLSPYMHIVDQMSRAVNLTFAEATVAALRAALDENPEVFPIF